ncbi:calcium-binding protein [Mesorhizobium sp.]|uniref:calcium-binding protein n=1 Tax=Mesorhizobium sp. TaxID=1871066 RepID=UPI000FE5C8EB|nr:calcium-binding protein [Mesorhizobium sp.]RWC64014.1 MAG: hypothetical protein EOS29_13395 [Mesorhizobium sp.]RWC64147.1 MAG: hypothetical protein EOS56_00040 [Mesorhizobium sp.]
MSSGNDTITGTSAADIIDAGEGDDVVNALGGNDTITGGKGDDILNGGVGNDTYNYARGDGNDTITELSLGGSSDRLVFTGINQADVTLVRNGTDVTLVIAESAPGAGDGGSILLKDNFEDVTDRGIDRIVFADGTNWTRANLRTAFLAQSSSAGNDTITGFGSNDTITGGGGNDVIDGGKGNDIYNYARGHGNDTIIEAASGGADDRLVLQGINPSAVTLVRNGNDVTLVIAESAPGADDGGSVLLKDNFEEYYDQGIDKIVFGDGTIWTRAALRTAFLAQSSTTGNDVITGFAVNDTINAGNGSDQVFAGDGADALTGGKGDDSLYGGTGNDTYTYARGDGNDTIQEDSGGGADDRLILTGINPADVTLVRSGADASLVIAESAPGAGDGGSILLKANFDEDNGRGVDRIVFANGTIWTRADLRAIYLAQASTTGNDTITGFAGADIINAGGGNDIVDAGAGDDTLTGGAGNDTLSGGDGSDTYHYARGDGIDTIAEGPSSGGADSLVLDGLNPADVTVVRNGTDAVLVVAESAPGAGDGGFIQLKSNFDLYPNSGVDSVVFANGTVWLKADLLANVAYVGGTAGDETITGTAGDDLVRAGKGNDVLLGGNGNDTYRYARGDGNDTIVENTNGGNNDQLILEGINPSAVTLVRNGNHVTVVIAESAPGAGDGGSVLLKENLEDNADRGIDKLVFADGTIWTRADIRTVMLDRAGTAGNDTITGFSTADTLRGRSGDDTLDGASGNDTYVYARGDGNDTITEGYSNGTGDRLILTDINTSSVSLLRNGTDVTLVIAESAPGAGDGGSVLLKNTLNDDRGVGIDQVVFADGTIWTRAAIRAMLLDQAGTAGNDTVLGFNTADTINGRGGNDTLDGASGDDSYIYARGDGNDTITEGYSNGTNDRLVFTDINASAVSLVRNGTDVTVIIAESAPGAGDGGSVLIKNTLDDDRGVGVDKIVFANGTIWTRADIRAMLVSASGTSGNDVITGTSASDIIAGRQGNDTLDGGASDDTYIYARGDGNDTITEGYNNGANDRLVFTDVNAGSVSLVRNGTDVTVVVAESAPGAGDGGSVLFKNTLNDDRGVGVDKIVFADGTIWTRADIRVILLDQAGTAGNDTITGFNVADTLQGRAGNDNLDGSSGDDTYIYARGDGNDTITEGYNAGAGDRLGFTDINAGSVSLVRNGTDVTVVIAESTPGAGDGGSVLLKNTLTDDRGVGVDKVVFADGTIWTRVAIMAMLLDQAGTAGNDTILGFNVADTIRGRGGNDSLDGSVGDDSYVYARGDGNDTITEGYSNGTGDRLVFTDINASAVSMVRNGADVTVVIAESTPGGGDGGSVLIKNTLDDDRGVGVDKVVFADGTTWTRADIRVMLLDQAGTSGNDTITGFNVADTIRGRGGNDSLDGASGDDTYIYARGDGNDTITEGYSNGTNDRLVFTDINAGSVSLVRSGTDVTVVIAESTPGAGDGGSVLIKNTLDDDRGVGVDKVVFADGTTWTRADIRILLLDQVSTAGNDIITGFNVADTIRGRAGNDTLNGAAGDDTYIYARGDGNDTITDSSGGADKLVLTGISSTEVTVFSNGPDITILIPESAPGAGNAGSIILTNERTAGLEQIVFSDVAWTRAQLVAAISYYGGTSGNDTITGTSAADDIRAGLGDDLLAGQAGNDSYTYASGDGNDVISEIATGTDVDTLVLSGLNQADVRFERPSSDLTDVVIRVLSTGQTIRLDNQFDQEGGVEKIVFHDGSVLGGNDWSLDATLRGLVTIYGTAGNDTIYGSTTDNDTLDGGAGDDWLAGEEGSDTYIYAAGYGNDFVNEKATGTDKDILVLRGLNQADVSFERPFADLTDVVIRIKATGETFTLDNQFDQEDGVEKIVFHDGSVIGGNDWSLDTTLLGLVTIYGTAGNDTIYGSTTSNDILDGGAGDDWLAGEEGSDTYIYAAGYGNDFVNEKATGTDKDFLVLRGLNQADISIERPSSDMTDIVIRINATGETFTLDNQFDQEDGVEKIAFNDGSVLGGNDWSLDGVLANLATITGTAAAETIVGTSAADKIFGGGGADTLTGGAGSDTFIFKSGFGLDNITDFAAGAGSQDIVQFGNDVFADFSSVLAAATQVGADTVITHDASNVLTLKNVALANLHQDDFQFITA